MSISHTFVNLAGAAACWLLAAWLLPGCERQEAPAPALANPLAFCGSPSGALAAGLIKSTLHTYWHAGASAAEAHDKPPVSPFRLRAGFPQPGTVTPATAAHPPPSWVERLLSTLADLEKKRAHRDAALPISPAHQRYLNAAAHLRLRLAYALQPGDPALYEIMHLALENSGADPQAVRRLALHTASMGLSPIATPDSSLAGAGAMLNALNESLRAKPRDSARLELLRHDWELHRRCLERHRELVSEGQHAGWWKEVPEARRAEISFYAGLVSRLSEQAATALQIAGINTGSP